MKLVITLVNAKKEPIAADQGLALAKQASRIYAAKGRKIVEFSCRSGKLLNGATDEELSKAIIGPSGNLRAPSLWTGKTLIVGFNPDMYAAHL